MTVKNLQYELDPEHTAISSMNDDSDPARRLDILWDPDSVDITGHGGDDDTFVSILDIPVETFERLAIDFLKARRVTLATVVTWAVPDSNDETEIRGHGELVDEVHIDMGWLENEPAQCPICMTELERTEGAPNYEYKHVTLNLWDEAAQDYVEKTTKVRYLMGSQPGELLPCPECGFDWAKDEDDDDRIVQHAMEWQQKESADGHAG